MDWMDHAEKPGPLRAPAVLINEKKLIFKGTHFLSLFVGFILISCFFSGSFGYFGFPTLWILWMLCDTLTSHLNFRSRIYADVFWILSIWHLIRLWLLIINLCVNVYHCLLFFFFCFCPCLLSSVSFVFPFCLSVPPLAFPVLFSRNPIQFAIVSLTVTLHFLQPFVLQTFSPASDH